MKNLCLVTLFAAFAVPVHSYALDPADQEALQQTQKLINDQSSVEAFAKSSPEAAKAFLHVKQVVLTNPKKQAEINAISSEIFADIVKEANGDPTAIDLKLQQALRDPQSFLNKLSPTQQAKIQAMSAALDSTPAAEKRDPASNGEGMR